MNEVIKKDLGHTPVAKPLTYPTYTGEKPIIVCALCHLSQTYWESFKVPCTGPKADRIVYVPLPGDEPRVGHVYHWLFADGSLRKAYSNVTVVHPVGNLVALYGKDMFPLGVIHLDKGEQVIFAY
jgi:hypothetical protein